MPYSAHFSFDAIGTHWEIELSLEKKRESVVLGKIKNRIEEFDKTYSRFRDDSLITQISQSKGIYKIPGDFVDLFEVYKSLNDSTNGLFTPLVGDVLDDLGYDKNYSLNAKTAKVPPKFLDIVSLNSNTLHMKEPVLLDFGAGGKGYLVDIIGKILKTEDVSEFLINAGGDILHHSTKGNKIRIGLENPHDTKQVIGVAEISNNSICGSAGNRRRWGNFHHIINPETLLSPMNIEAVWVVAPSALIADSLTTALYLDQSKKTKTAYPCEYFILYADMTFEKSAGFDAELFLG